MIQALRGTADILPEKIKMWQYFESIAKEVFEKYNFTEIRTPIIEHTELFTRAIGEVTDVVEKEMYTFCDRKERSITLRPEGTASVVRACLEHSLINQKIAKLYYFGPMFRYERPQAGRQRQFHQIGVEFFGTYSPIADAEVIAMMVNFFEKLGLKDLVVKINSLGDKQSLENYKAALTQFIKNHSNKLCQDCIRRLDKNVLRVLDCKVPDCKAIFDSNEIPKINDSLTTEAQEYYATVLNILDKLNIKYQETPRLVRGLDYYTHTIFEVSHNTLGSQDALGGGGRYNNLVEELGGKPTGAVGFAIGAERLAIILSEIGIALPIEKTDAFLISLDEIALIENQILADKLRKLGFNIKTIYEKCSIKSQMRQADSCNARFVIMRGETERQQQQYKLKNMTDGTEQYVSEFEIVEKIK